MAAAAGKQPLRIDFSGALHTMNKISVNDAAQNPNISDKILLNEPSQYVKERSHTAKTQQIMSTRQMQNLIKNDEQVFLAVVRTLNDFVLRRRGKRGGNQRSASCAAVNSAHGPWYDRRPKEGD